MEFWTAGHPKNKIKIRKSEYLPTIINNKRNFFINFSDI